MHFYVIRLEAFKEPLFYEKDMEIPGPPVEFIRKGERSIEFLSLNKSLGIQKVMNYSLLELCRLLVNYDNYKHCMDVLKNEFNKCEKEGKTHENKNEIWVI